MATELSRRDVLRVVVVSGAAMPFVSRAAFAGADETGPGYTSIIGDVINCTRSSMSIRTSSGEVTVTPAGGARMYSGAFGDVGSMADFIPGDRVVAQGNWSNGMFSAAAVGSAYKPMEARVDSVSNDGTVAHTSIGDVLLDQSRLPNTPESAQPPAPRPSAGDVLSGLEWQHPETGDRYLMIAG
jgi:hypothetical protein